MSDWRNWPDRHRSRNFHDVQRLVSAFEVAVEGPPGGRLRIKILEDAAGRFIAVPNFMRQSVDMASPYWSIHPEPSIDAAFDDCLDGLFAWGEDAFWVLNPSFSSDPFSGGRSG